MKFITFLLGLAKITYAHTTFTTLFIDEKNQGDGTCVRMPYDDDTATTPVRPIDSPDMACNRNGSEPVKFVCPAKKGSTLTFEFRIWPDAQKPGSIDPGHLGPCAVYVKKVDNMLTDEAQGPGWFKIWEDGYDSDTQRWCVNNLVKNNGLLSVQLPRGLPYGYYLVRPEILALHYARHGDPQYFTGCAQIFVNSDVEGPLEIPQKYNATIPGYVNLGTPGLATDIYDPSFKEYHIPGPRVWMPPVKRNSSSTNNANSNADVNHTQKIGAIPEDCIMKNANWCAKAIQPYSGEDACWSAVKECYAQSEQCWLGAPASGSMNCYPWSNYCMLLNEKCERGVFEGPPVFDSVERNAPVPGKIPRPWNNVFEEDA